MTCVQACCVCACLQHVPRNHHFMPDVTQLAFNKVIGILNKLEAIRLFHFMKGTRKPAVPTTKNCALDSPDEGERRGQFRRSAMAEPHPGCSACMITQHQYQVSLWWTSFLLNGKHPIVYAMPPLRIPIQRVCTWRIKWLYKWKSPMILLTADCSDGAKAS